MKALAEDLSLADRHGTELADLSPDSGSELADLVRNSGTELTVFWPTVASEENFVLDITDFPEVT